MNPAPGAAMKFTWICPKCRVSLEFRQRHPLRQRKCPNCGTPISPRALQRVPTKEEFELFLVVVLGGCGLIAAAVVALPPWGGTVFQPRPCSFSVSQRKG